MAFTTARRALDLPAPIDAWSRLVCQEDGPLVLAVLESRGSIGPWAAVDAATGRVAVGSDLAPVSDGVLDPAGAGLLLTQRGLARVAADDPPRVLGLRGAGVGRGKDDHEQLLDTIAPDVAVVGRWSRAGAKLVRVSTGEVIRRLSAQGPFLAMPAAAGRSRLWAFGSGTVVALDASSWRTLERSAAPRGLAACWTPYGAVALLGEADPAYREGAAHALLRDLAPPALRSRLRSPFGGLRLALLDERLDELASADAPWLSTALPDPDGRGVAWLRADGEGRAVLATSLGLTVIDPATLEPLGQHRTDWLPTSWSGASRAVHRSGPRELTVVEWSAGSPAAGVGRPATTMG
ncbi:hypothetical protein [Agrococcus sp. HG114]|uniref:hypothetical protein n=1 Tax=Agrococcus sp. HG114 TaxID=2969757 RepID=UPI00215A3479|nr:hypothetical protein [Agrococcus sp. HG114]MCR8669958.1 hypothetical protein [Agrococcus sp. HG114]